ncbi:unnamed protein product, partial [Polarella glacialis]
IAAMWGSLLGDSLGVSSDQRKVLVACGAGAGLAAVYSVPISGFLYTIEHVLSWDTSLGSVLPAAVTSIIATAVAGIVVENKGLYAMPRYSYDWPSMAMLLWAAMIGPLAGLAAVSFRRVVKLFENLKPLPRFHVTFKAAAAGDRVWFPRNLNGWEMRQGAIIARRTSDHIIIVGFDGETTEKVYDAADWELANPEGRRDWTILVAMPAASLLLGILSHDFPSLLGNGRALAEVAIKRERTFSFFVLLLFLKAAMTAAAIGSGAAGGTLTPSVALGATLGAIVGDLDLLK